MRGCAAPCFNPSLALLPPNFVAALGNAIGGETKPKYMASFRRSNSLCLQLNAQNALDRRKLANTNAHIHTTFAVLDENMNVVANVTKIRNRFGTDLPWHLPQSCQYEDVRLEACETAVNRVLAHGMNYAKGYPRWHLWWFELKVIEESKPVEVMALIRDFQHPDVEMTDSVPELQRGRNYGVMWNCSVDKSFHVVHGLKNHLDVRRGITTGAAKHYRGKLNSRADISPLFESVKGTHVMHNSASPINLESIGCPGLLLALAHAHIDTQLNQGKAYGQTRFGNTYIYNFVIYNSTLPYSLVAISPPFCFPSVNMQGKCDIIQFVAGMTKRDANDPTKVLLTLGVNDCEAAYLEIDIVSALLYTSAHFTAKHCQARNAIRHRHHHHPPIPSLTDS